MEYIMGGRGSGKTTEIVNRVLADEQGILVCHNNEEVKRLLSIYPKLENKICTIHAIKHVGYVPLLERRRFYLDNADYVLRAMIPWGQVVTASLNTGT